MTKSKKSATEKMMEQVRAKMDELGIPHTEMVSVPVTITVDQPTTSMGRLPGVLPTMKPSPTSMPLPGGTGKKLTVEAADHGWRDDIWMDGGEMFGTGYHRNGWRDRGEL